MSDIDLSGPWIGFFNYPAHRPAVQFEAELRDDQGRITGFTTEPGDTWATAGLTIQAVIDGHRRGERISFVKMYEETAEAYDLVHYEGVIDASGDEIDGSWTIPGELSGTFVMIRGPGAEESVSQRAAEEIGSR